MSQIHQGSNLYATVCLFVFFIIFIIFFLFFLYFLLTQFFLFISIVVVVVIIIGLTVIVAGGKSKPELSGEDYNHAKI